MRATDAPAQLMQLSESQLIGPIDDDGIRGRHVDAAFHDRRADEQIGALMIKVEHHLFEFTLSHLSVADRDACLRDQLSERLRGLLDRIDAVVNKINLTTAA